jgi:predicted alpha-1,6-mannanase (GH76 family)
MQVNIKWFDNNGKLSFNVGLTTKEGRDEFLSIKGCRIVTGKDGDFVAYPATKNENTGKWWNHVWGSDEFNSVILAKALHSRPSASTPTQNPSNSSSSRNAGGDSQDFEDDIPF